MARRPRGGGGGARALFRPPRPLRRPPPPLPGEAPRARRASPLPAADPAAPRLAEDARPGLPDPLRPGSQSAGQRLTLGRPRGGGVGTRRGRGANVGPELGANLGSRSGLWAPTGARMRSQRLPGCSPRRRQQIPKLSGTHRPSPRNPNLSSGHLGTGACARTYGSDLKRSTRSEWVALPEPLSPGSWPETGRAIRGDSLLGSASRRRVV